MLNLLRSNLNDIVIATFLALTFSVASYHTSMLIPSMFMTERTRQDVWFDGDIAPVYEVMTDKTGEAHVRSRKHPLFGLITLPPTVILKKAFNLDSLTAVRIMLASVGFLWIFTFFLLLRCMSCRRLDASLLTILLGVSASSLFWFTVSETFSFGSLTILFAFMTVVLSQRYSIPIVWYCAMNILTLSMTITNWMAGILATKISNTTKTTSHILIYSFAITTALWGIQRLFFPADIFFIDVVREKRYLFTEQSGGILNSTIAFLYHSLIMPTIDSYVKYKNTSWPVMTVQHSSPGSATTWGQFAVLLWSGLLLCGSWALFTLKVQNKTRIFIGAMLVGQLTVHLIYGNETFLYSLHFIILLISLVALASLTRLRPVIIALTILLIPCALINNVIQFKKALEFIKTHGTPNDQVRIQMHFRPNDPWPRGQGRVILAYPGTLEKSKAYHEPGGSFSPLTGSFGISIWITDKQGNLITTSDSIPLENIQQKFIPIDQESIPGISTETENYSAIWYPAGEGKWKLTFTPKRADVQYSLIVRSVGPAGGPINSLIWNDGKLRINDRWNLTVDQKSSEAHLGNENKVGWVKDTSSLNHWSDDNGWGYARIPLPNNEIGTIHLDAPPLKTNHALRYTNTRANLDLSLPDPQFIDSLNAQVAHLMMGTVGLQTRPGDPMNYSQTWQREAAHIIVALAKAGQIDVAKQFSIYVAENDFFGGFGADADAPGLAIWALNEVAERANDPEYDQKLWPHVQRKAKFIERMLTARQPISEIFRGLPVPKLKEESFSSLTKVSNKARNDLIMGKIQVQFPVLYVNAVSYLGLVEAASFAGRINHSTQAKRWRVTAVAIKQAWWEKFILSIDVTPDPRTLSNVLWPTNITSGHNDLLMQVFEKRWKQSRSANDDYIFSLDKTYFSVAEAHQWLWLGDVNRTWKSLRWFWKNQTSPGLYTWWERVEKGDTYTDWENVRSRMNTQYVSPHYWTAAEMLSLQLDMLAYLDKNEAVPTVVIGAGVPKEWLSSPIKVTELSLPRRSVSWYWDGKEMHVHIKGETAEVKLGSAFEGVRINLKN